MPIETAIENGFLTPMLALAAWTLVMWIWMYATRIPAMQAAKIDPQDAKHPGGVLAERVPSGVRAVADNYNHLHEQPTIFYALMTYIALTGGGDGLATLLAWAYVGLRVAHSLIQSTVNIVFIRFLVFATGSLVLMALAVKSVLRLVG